MGSEGVGDRVAMIVEGYDDLGIHRTGTAVDDAGADWFVERLAEVGVAAGTDRFEFERLDVIDANVEVDGAQVDGTPLFDGGRTGEHAIGGTLAELATPGVSTSENGTPTIGYAEVATNPYADLATLRRGTDHAAIVLVPNPDAPLPGLSILNAPDYGEPFGPPVIQVSNEHTALFRDAVGRRCDVIVQTRQTTCEVANVVASVPGTVGGAAPVVVMTPRSSWWQSTGERGGGIAVFFEIARAVAAAGCHRTVRFLASTGHELGHLGLEHHLRSEPDLAGGAHAWIHLGANFGATSRTHVITQSSDQEFGTLLAEAVASVDITPTMLVPGTDRPIGEAENIFDAGGRYVSIVGAQDLFHHELDRWPSNVDADLVTRLAVAMSGLAVALASA
jgi:hypothetical protein